jgi:E3 ubiquitin-protein ligase SspH2
MLSNLSDNLPPGLVHLDASHNQLTSTPENIPSGITSLDLSNNQLISLTEGITRLPEGGSVNLANNRLSEGVLNNLRAIVNAEDYRGPTFQFSVHGGGKKATRPLQHAVADWYGENAESVRTTWSDFEQEEGAKEFSLFLDVLIDTYLNKGEFRQEIREWLSHLANNPELRKNSFMLSFGATESCHDRVSIQYNDMKKARLIDDIEKGAYDERLSELIPIARGMFRLDKLEEIAREKYESLRLRDEIEVYLAYQVQLRDRLKLPLDTKMLFFSLSGVTGKDLEEAEKKVKKLENDEFIQYLSTQWGPWQSLLKRLNTEQQKKSEAELLNAVGGELADNVNARLKKEGLVGVLEAEVAFGVEEKKKIAHRINDKLTREFLQTQGIAHLLDEQWELETEDTGESSEAGGSKGKSRAE